MVLNINSPAYYTNIYGIDDEVYWMCRELSDFVKEKKYSNIIDIVGVVPIIAPKNDIDKGLWKEVKKCDLKFRVATVSLHISFDEYIQSDIKKKKSLIIDNILKSVKVISKKGQFNFDDFKEDVINFCEMNWVKHL
jgi:hypothetical protein